MQWRQARSAMCTRQALRAKVNGSRRTRIDDAGSGPVLSASARKKIGRTCRAPRSGQSAAIAESSLRRPALQVAASPPHDARCPLHRRRDAFGGRSEPWRPRLTMIDSLSTMAAHARQAQRAPALTFASMASQSCRISPLSLRDPAQRLGIHRLDLTQAPFIMIHDGMLEEACGDVEQTELWLACCRDSAVRAKLRRGASLPLTISPYADWFSSRRDGRHNWPHHRPCSVHTSGSARRDRE